MTRDPATGAGGRLRVVERAVAPAVGSVLAWALLASTLAGCASHTLLSRDGVLVHRTRGYVVRDLATDGWQQTRVEGAEVAFTRQGEGVIALRSDCGDETRSATARSRALWHRVPYGQVVRRAVRVGEHDAVETAADSNGTRVRTLVIENGNCAFDLIRVAPDGAGDETFELFVHSLRFVDLPEVATP